MTEPGVFPDSFGATHKVWRSLVPSHSWPVTTLTAHKEQWPQFLIDTIMRMADPMRTIVGRAQGEVFSTRDFLEKVALELSLKDLNRKDFKRVQVEQRREL